jgi:hypothetical protein
MELDEHMWCWDGYRMEEMKAWKIAMCEQMNDGMGCVIDGMNDLHI